MSIQVWGLWRDQLEARQQDWCHWESESQSSQNPKRTEIPENEWTADWSAYKKHKYQRAKTQQHLFCGWVWGFQTSKVPTMASSNHNLKCRHRLVPWQRLLMCALCIMHHWISNKMHIILKSTGDKQLPITWASQMRPQTVLQSTYCLQGCFFFVFF